MRPDMEEVCQQHLLWICNIWLTILSGSLCNWGTLSGWYSQIGGLSMTNIGGLLTTNITPFKSSQRRVFTMRYTISNLLLFRVLFAGGVILVAGATGLGGAVASGVEEVRFFPALDSKIHSTQLSFDLPRSLLSHLRFMRRPSTALCSVTLISVVLPNGAWPVIADSVVRFVN